MEEFSVIGKSVPRVDALEKVTGRARYCVDVELPRMLHAKVLRSKYPYARILGIDTSEAGKLPGVQAVITAEDTLKQKTESIWRGIPDKYVLALDKVRYVGEEVAAVAAEDELTAEEALGLIRVEYEELTAVFDPEESIKPGAPKIHDAEGNIAAEVEIEFGDLAKGIQEADYVIEDRFVTQYYHPCHLEPMVCIAAFDSSGKLTFYENSADPFRNRRLVAKALGIDPSKVRIVQEFMGGNHGCWQCELSQYVITALLSTKTGRPVRLVNTREEELTATRLRMPQITYLKAGVKKDGTLTARHYRVIANCGAYSGYAPIMMRSGLRNSTGLYRCPNVRLEGKCVYTNMVPTGPARAFGTVQQAFSTESLMDMVADKLGMDPVELRLRNATRTGDVTVVGQKIGSGGLLECMDKVTSYSGWKEKRLMKQPNRGIGMALGMANSDSRESDFGGSIIYINVLEDGRIRIVTGEYEWGQGSKTIMSQIVAEELTVPLESVEFSKLDTDTVPYTLGPYGGGRLVSTAGNAVRLAALEAKKQLFATAAKMFGAGFEDLEMKDQKIFIGRIPEKVVSIADVASYARYSGTEIIGTGVYDPPHGGA
ncbi:xanthine dehydrogenase family protein molybdopterin-binding subunit [Chloroflexota bacterium]